MCFIRVLCYCTNDITISVLLENNMVYTFWWLCRSLSLAPATKAHDEGIMHVLAATWYIIRVCIGWLGACQFVIVRVEVVHCVRLSLFSYILWRHCFCLPACSTTLLKHDVQIDRWSCALLYVWKLGRYVVSLEKTSPKNVQTAGFLESSIDAIHVVYRYLVALWCVNLKKKLWCVTCGHGRV